MKAGKNALTKFLYGETGRFLNGNEFFFHQHFFSMTDNIIKKIPPLFKLFLDFDIKSEIVKRE